MIHAQRTDVTFDQQHLPAKRGGGGVSHLIVEKKSGFMENALKQKKNEGLEARVNEVLILQLPSEVFDCLRREIVDRIHVKVHDFRNLRVREVVEEFQ